MTTLLEYVVAGFEKNPDGTISTLSEWSLCCMTALRAKDVNSSSLIHLITAKTIENLLVNLNLEPTRPWTSVRKIEDSIKLRIETPLLAKIAQIEERNKTLYADNSILRNRFTELEMENIRLQNEIRDKPKGWFSKQS